MLYEMYPFCDTTQPTRSRVQAVSMLPDSSNDSYDSLVSPKS